MDFEQLKEAVASKLTCDEILDIIGYTPFELVEALSEEIKEMLPEFKRAIND